MRSLKEIKEEVENPAWGGLIFAFKCYKLLKPKDL